MTHGISGLSPRASLDATQAAAGTRGSFRGAAVEAAPAQPRAASALKTAWLEVRHFFASLVGMRVSTTKPETVADAASATRGVLHAMTKRDLDTLDVAEALVGMTEHGAFPQDLNRTGITEGAAGLFRPALQDLSDLQLMRLQANLCRKPDLLEGLSQLGTGFVMDADEPSVAAMAAGGQVNDLGFVMMSLHTCLRAELADRGLVPADLPGTPAALDPGLERFAQRAVANEGDLRAAIGEARVDLARARETAVLDALEQAGLYTREAEAPPEAPPAPPPAPPDNAAVNAPFGEARRAWIVETLNQAYLPQNQASERTGAVPVGPTGAFAVAQIFKRDMIGARDIAFAGERLPGTEGGTAALDANVAQFCQALGEKGATKGDILALSRVMNQATTGVVASQYMLDPDNAPGLRLADGDTVPIIADLKGGAWSITPSGTGYEIGYRAGQDLDGSAMATQGSRIFRFGEGSRLDVTLTFVLERGTEGELAVTGMRDSRIAIRAFDTEGRQLA